MVTYTVYYKSPRMLFWRKIKNVKGDTIIETRNRSPLPARVLLLADETRIEIPMDYLIKFSKERHAAILEDMKKQGVNA